MEGMKEGTKERINKEKWEETYNWKRKIVRQRRKGNVDGRNKEENEGLN